MASSAEQGMLALRQIRTPISASMFVQCLVDACQAAKFSAVEAEVAGLLQAQLTPRQSVELLTSSLEDITSCNGHESSAAPAQLLPVSNILLRQVEPLLASGQLDHQDVKERGGQLFAACCTACHECDSKQGAKQYARLALRLAEAYSLREDHLPPGTSLQKPFALFMSSKGSLQQAAGLLMLFPQLARQVDLEAVLAAYAAARMHAAGCSIASVCGATAQLVWVQQCLALDQLKPALHACLAFGLQASFPDLEGRWQEHSMERCMAKAKWGAAGVIAGDRADLQLRLVQRLLHKRELTLAADFCAQFSLAPSILDCGLTAEETAAALAAETARHLQLGLPPRSIVFVDSAPQLQVAQQALMQADVVGVDGEWVPTRNVGDPIVPSILQVATADQVFIFDLLALPAAEAAASADAVRFSGLLDACLTLVLASPHPLKLGCGIAGDLRQLAAAFPSMRCFAQVAGVVEIRAVWSRHAVAAEQWLADHPQQKADSMSLTAMAHSVLGKPLNKALQTSNWGARPLSAQQLLYAALDAHVCLQIWAAIGGNQPHADMLLNSLAVRWPA